MSQVCLYFQLHQPYRLQDFKVFDVGNGESYFDYKTEKAHNREIFQKVAKKSYLPMLKLLKKLTLNFPDFVFALSCSGVFLEQAEKYYPEVITILQDLSKTNQVEFLAETYHHSLASLYSPSEFKIQVKMHEEKINELFHQKPKVFRNTELIYSNEIAEKVVNLGYKGMLTEAVARYDGENRKTRVLCSYTKKKLPLLLKHAQLSDDVAFRFSDKNWHSYPLTAKKYLKWIEAYSEKQIINLFMDFETFGEHQWQDTGIFEFFADFVQLFLNKPWNSFKTPEQLFRQKKSEGNFIANDIYDVPQPISWADVDRDLTAWIDNDFQQDTINALYSFEKKILNSKNEQLIEDWRKLQTSDHFYYMCTKWSADGDVHAYFSPYKSPFEAYRRYAIVLADLKERLF